MPESVLSAARPRSPEQPTRAPRASFVVDGTLGQRFSGADNSLNLIRLVLAGLVILSHAGPLGLGQPDLGQWWFQGHADLGKIAVTGFFALSGFLITRSGRRTPPIRFAWHRALRILPGYWFCLVVTALAIAPLLWWRAHGTLSGYLGASPGPWGYIHANWWTSLTQRTIGDLLHGTPYYRLSHSRSFNGALWSLRYELLCYVAVLALMVTGVLRRARWVVPALLALVAARLLCSPAAAWAGLAHPPFHHTVGPLPGLGPVDVHTFAFLLLAFLAGAVLEVYRDVVPFSGVAAVVCLVGVVLTTRYGGFFLVGAPLMAYFLLWAAVRLPRRLRRVGRRRDLSYGLYIYGFPVEQVLGQAGVAAHVGLGGFLVLAYLGAGALALVSWHLIEAPALSLKDWSPARTRDSVRRRLEARRPAPQAAAGTAAE